MSKLYGVNHKPKKRTPEAPSLHERDELARFVFERVIWGHPEHPRVCVKYPDGYDWEHKEYGIPKLPKGTVFLVPATPDTRYDVITSLTFEQFDPTRQFHGLSNDHLMMYDIDDRMSYRYQTTAKQFMISGLRNQREIEFSFPSIKFENGFVQTPNIVHGVPFMSGSGHLHIFDGQGPAADSLSSLVIGVSAWNPNWAWYAGANGFFSLRPPHQPKLSPFKSTFEVWRENLRVLSAEDHLLEWKDPRPRHDIGWYWTLGEDGTLHNREPIFARYTHVPAEPENDLTIKVKQMMREEANRLIAAQTRRNNDN